MIIRVRDLIRADSQATIEAGWRSVGQTQDALQALCDKLDGNAAVVDTDHRSTIDAILLDTIEPG
jgi:hypothetical protein